MSAPPPQACSDNYEYRDRLGDMSGSLIHQLRGVELLHFEPTALTVMRVNHELRIIGRIKE